MDKFLKYEAIFTDADIGIIRFGTLQTFGNPIMGASMNNFHIKKLLHELIYE